MSQIINLVTMVFIYPSGVLVEKQGSSYTIKYYYHGPCKREL